MNNFTFYSPTMFAFGQGEASRVGALDASSAAARCCWWQAAAPCGKTALMTPLPSL